jgi:hypothetical protein
MAVSSQITADNTITLRVKVELDPTLDQALSQSQAGISSSVRSLSQLDAGYQAVGRAATQAGEAAYAAGERISAAATGWDRLAGRYDAVTRAANAVTAAQTALDRANASLKQRLADTTISATEQATVMAQSGRVLDTLSDKVTQAATKYVQLRAAQQQA